MFTVETENTTKNVKTFEKAIEEARELAKKENTVATVYNQEQNYPVATFGDVNA